MHLTQQTIRFKFNSAVKKTSDQKKPQKKRHKIDNAQTLYTSLK